MDNRIIKDKFSLHDEFSKSPSGLWARTEVIGGYGGVNYNPNGKSTLGEVCFSQHNIVPIGGVSYVMQRIFEIPETQIEVPTLYEEAINVGDGKTATGIGAANSLAPTEKYDSPDGKKNVNYRYGHFVQLFGVGVTGTGESDVTIYHPDYREKEISISKVNPDGLTVTGVMYPFRYTAETLSELERKQYFGKKVDPDTGATGYYLKRFETDAVIKHVWKTGEDVDDETLIDPNDVWNNTSGLNAVESFTEIVLKVNKKDVKEIFIQMEQPDRTRINTIALFNGRFVKDESNAADYGDYEDVRLFSKLCINPEYLDLNKDLYIIYRIYGA